MTYIRISKIYNDIQLYIFFAKDVHVDVGFFFVKKGVKF